MTTTKTVVSANPTSQGVTRPVHIASLPDVSPGATFVLVDGGASRRHHLHMIVRVPDIHDPQELKAFFQGCQHLAKDLRERTADVRGDDPPYGADPMFPECRTSTHGGQEFIYEFWWPKPEWDIPKITEALNPRWFGTALRQFIQLQMKS